MNPEPQEDPKQNKLQFNKPASKDQAANGLGKSTVDINAPGQYEGQSIYDVDLDSFEEKPWRKPGSDITDYFNYGFNEQTWRAYCLKQKQIREESNLQKRINVYESGSNDQDLGFGEQQPTMGRSGRGGFINENSRMNSNLSRKMLRDQDDSVIQVMSGDSHEGKSISMMPIDSMKMNSRIDNEYMGNPMNSHSYPMPDFNIPPDNMGMFGNDPNMNGPPQFWGPEMDPIGPMGYDFPQQQRGRGNMSMRNMPPMQMRNMPGQFWDNNQHNSNNQMNRMQQHNYNNFNQGRNNNSNSDNNMKSNTKNKQSKSNDRDQSQERDRHDDSKSKDENTSSSRHSRSEDREHKKSKNKMDKDKKKDKRSRSSNQDDERWSRKRSHDNDDNQKSKRRY